MSDNEAEKPASLMPPPEGYADWLGDIETQIHEAQQRASQALNLELVTLYWRIGRAILDQQDQQGWGAKIIDRLAQDLRTNFPEMKGFSPRNLKYMRSFAEAWPESEICAPAAAQMEGRAIGQEVLGQLEVAAIVHQPGGSFDGGAFVQAHSHKLPWYHHIALPDKLKTREDRLWYAAKVTEHNWSRNILVMQIESGLMERSGAAVTNFALTLPKPESDLARESRNTNWWNRYPLNSKPACPASSRSNANWRAPNFRRKRMRYDFDISPIRIMMPM